MLINSKKKKILQSGEGFKILSSNYNGRNIASFHLNRYSKNFTIHRYIVAIKKIFSKMQFITNKI